MEVIGHLVGIRANQGALHAVDGAIKHIERNALELCWEGGLQLRIKMLPEPPAPADEILPGPRLAFMHSRRGAARQGGRFKIGPDPLLVQGVPGFV